MRSPILSVTQCIWGICVRVHTFIEMAAMNEAMGIVIETYYIDGSVSSRTCAPRLQRRGSRQQRKRRKVKGAGLSSFPGLTRRHSGSGVGRYACSDKVVMDACLQLCLVYFNGCHNDIARLYS